MSAEFDRMLIILGAIALIALLFALPRRKKPYKNFLNLQAIPDIKDLGLNTEFFSSIDDEFIYILDKLAGNRREEKSLADFVTNREQRKALLSDLDQLGKRARLEIEREGMRPPEERLARVIDTRKTFLEKTVPYEEGKLLSWEPPVEQTEQFDFVNLKGVIFLIRQGDELTKLRLQFQETGVFSIRWKQAGDMGREQEVIEENINVEKLPCEMIKAVTLHKRSGLLYIINHTRNDVSERIPV